VRIRAQTAATHTCAFSYLEAIEKEADQHSSVTSMHPRMAEVYMKCTGNT